MAATKKPKTIELREGTLAVVFEGLKTVKDGPHKGNKTVGAVKIYVGEEQVGVLQHFKMEAMVNEPLPRLEFDFWENPTKEEIPPTLKSSLEKTIARIREFFPWARYKSAVGSSPPEELPPAVPEQPH